MELVASGFPMPSHGCPHCGYDAWNNWPPTLSDLLKEVDGHLIHLRKWNGVWWAVSDKCLHGENCDCINNIEEVGNTPEEAVANLWLVLKNERVWN